MTPTLAPVEPARSLDTEPYWAGCREGRLMYQRCDHCGEVVFHARSHCPYCLTADPAWQQSAGLGRVYSCALQHVPLRGAQADFTPRALGIAELDEGFHMFTEFLLEGGDLPAIGDRVEVVFERLSETTTLPKFRRIA